LDEPIWIREVEALAMHDQQLALFGGSSGVRDLGLLQSALAKPRNIWAYAEIRPTLARLSAAYSFGISSNHPFLDGNKRTAFMVAATFLIVNGWEVVGSQEDVVTVMLGVAAGEVNEDQLAAWFETNIAKRTED
jgi:death-on-curing protein